MKLELNDIKAIKIKGRTNIDHTYGNPYKAVRVIISLEPIKTAGEVVTENKIVLTTRFDWGTCSVSGIEDTAAHLLRDTFGFDIYKLHMSEAWKNRETTKRAYPSPDYDFEPIN